MAGSDDYNEILSKHISYYLYTIHYKPYLIALCDIYDYVKNVQIISSYHPQVR